MNVLRPSTRVAPGEEHIPPLVSEPVSFSDLLDLLVGRDPETGMVKPNAEGLSIQKYNRDMKAALKYLSATFQPDGRRGPRADLVLKYKPSMRPEEAVIQVADVWRIDVGAAAKERWCPDVELGDGEMRGLLVITTNPSHSASSDPIGRQLRLRCQNSQMRDSFVQLVVYHVVLMRSVRTIPAMRAIEIRSWHAADADNSGNVDADEAVAGLVATGIDVDQAFVKLLLHAQAMRHQELVETPPPTDEEGAAEFDDDDTEARPESSNKSIDASLRFAEFCALVRGLLSTPAAAVREVIEQFASEFRKLSNAKDAVREPCMTAPDLQKFFVEAQGEAIDSAVAKSRVRTLSEGRSQEFVSGEDFFVYLMSTRLNSWLRPEHEAMHMDMKQALHHYFVFSSAHSASWSLDVAPSESDDVSGGFASFAKSMAIASPSAGSMAGPSFAASFGKASFAHGLVAGRSAQQEDRRRLTTAGSHVAFLLKHGVRCIDLEISDPVDSSTEPCVSVPSIRTDGVWCTLSEVLDAIVPRHVLERHGNKELSPEARRRGGPFEAFRFPLILSIQLHTTLSNTRTVARMLRQRLGSLLFDQRDMGAFRRTGRVFSPHELRDRILLSACVDDENAAAVTPTPGAMHELLRPLVVLPKRRYVREEWGAASEETDVVQLSLADVTAGAADAGSKAKWIDLCRKTCVVVRPAASTSTATPDEMDTALARGIQFLATNLPNGGPACAYERHFTTLNGRAGYLLKPAYMRKLRWDTDMSQFKFTIAVLQGMHMPSPPELAPGLSGEMAFTVAITGCEESDDREDPKGPPTRLVWRQLPVPEDRPEIVYCPAFDATPVECRVRGVELGRVFAQLEFIISDGSREVLGETSIPLRSIRMGYRAVPLWRPDENEQLRASVLCHFNMVRVQ